MPKIVGVVDYGVGNLFSVMRGIRAAECGAAFVSTPEQIDEVDVLLLPGVGAFGAGIKKLRTNGLDQAVIAFAGSGKPILGICLGMQFLMSRSLEFGDHAGLSLIPGNVVEIPRTPGWPVPNIGWNTVSLNRASTGTPFPQTSGGADFYFVHSYHCVPEVPDDVLGTIDYAGTKIVAMVSRDNVHGCQFHPEISDQAGIAIYRSLQVLA